MISLNLLREQLSNKKISCVELCTKLINRIENNKNLNAFLDFKPEKVIKEANNIDKQIHDGKKKPLLGIPIAHKDIFVTKDYITTAGSKMLENYKSPFDATVVAKLKDAGAITLGKLNCDEFAMGSSNENSFFGPVHNPWDPSRVPGGSSGGSAAAVAANLTPIATASDTGGSIREPASFCGITGIKPTYGSVSRWGMVAFASSLDQAGIMANSSEDAALVLQNIIGKDNLDGTSIHHPQPNLIKNINAEIKGKKIGLITEFLNEIKNSKTYEVIMSAVKEFENLGAIIDEVSLPHCSYGIPVYYVLAPAECSSNLSRYDGVKFGFRSKNFSNLEDMIVNSRSEGFGPEPKRRILIGTYVLSQGYYDAYYLKAQKVRNLIKKDFVDLFNNFDCLIGPVVSDEAFKLGEKTNDPISMYKSDLFTIPASLAGLPAMSIPCGFGNNKMPIGLQLIGNYFHENLLLNIANKYQQITNWHKLSPNGYALSFEDLL